MHGIPSDSEVGPLSGNVWTVVAPIIFIVNAVPPTSASPVLREIDRRMDGRGFGTGSELSERATHKPGFAAGGELVFLFALRCRYRPGLHFHLVPHFAPDNHLPQPGPSTIITHCTLKHASGSS